MALSTKTVFWGILIILLTHIWAIGGITDESLWFDEAWTVYAVSAPPPQTFEPPRGTRAQLTTPLRAALDDASTTLQRVRDDVHPPLYFLLMDAWVFIAGESVFALRYLSLLIALVGIAALYTLTRQLYSTSAAIYAAVLFGMSMLMVYYSREARMYTLLMTLSVASTLAYVRLMRRITVWRALLYGVIGALALYTHYAAALILLTHLLYALVMRRWRLIPMLMLPIVLFSPYIPTVWAQLVTNPAGSLAVPISTSLAVVSALGLLLTGGWWWVYVLALIGIFMARQPWQHMLLFVLWLLITPLVLLTVNATLMPIYQVRYALGALPAFAAIIGIGLAGFHRWQWGRWIAIAAAAIMIYAQITSYDAMFAPKPDYALAVANVIEERQPLEPIITDLAQRDPTRYYSNQLNLTEGIAVDLAWRDHAAAEIDEITARFIASDSVWLVMPVNVAKTWRMVAALQSQGRAVTQRDNVQNMLFYRFSAADNTELLQFTFEDASETTIASYNGAVAKTVTASTSEETCFDLDLTFEQTENFGVSLTHERGYNDVISQWNDLPTDTEACMNMPADVGDYYTYLTLYNTQTDARYAVMEHNVWWGWWVVTHHVAIR